MYKTVDFIFMPALFKFFFHKLKGITLQDSAQMSVPRPHHTFWMRTGLILLATVITPMPTSKNIQAHTYTLMPLCKNIQANTYTLMPLCKNIQAHTYLLMPINKSIYAHTECSLFYTDQPPFSNINSLGVAQKQDAHSQQAFWQ